MQPQISLPLFCVFPSSLCSLSVSCLSKEGELYIYECSLTFFLLSLLLDFRFVSCELAHSETGVDVSFEKYYFHLLDTLKKRLFASSDSVILALQLVMNWLLNS